MRDKYDDAIDYLTAHPREIEIVWANPHLVDAGCLFQFVTPTGMDGADYDECGCLTQLRKWEYWGAFNDSGSDESLAELVRADKRIPMNICDVKPEHLPIFAEWQRRLDVLIRGVDPETLSQPVIEPAGVTHDVL